MASYALPNDLLTNYPMPTDRVRVPQGYGRVDDTDLVYDRPRNTRRDHDELSDEFLIGVLHGLDLTDVSQRHTFIDAYCRPANDRRAYDQLPQELVNGSTSPTPTKSEGSSTSAADRLCTAANTRRFGRNSYCASYKTSMSATRTNSSRSSTRTAW